MSLLDLLQFRKMSSVVYSLCTPPFQSVGGRVSSVSGGGFHTTSADPRAAALNVQWLMHDERSASPFPHSLVLV